MVAGNRRGAPAGAALVGRRTAGALKRVLRASCAGGLLLVCAACSGDVDAAAQAAASAGDGATAGPAFEALMAEVPKPDPGPNPRKGALQSRFEQVINATLEKARRLSEGKAHAGNIDLAVCVLEIGDNPVELVARHADRPQRPASNMKLVTTAAALVLLGPGQEFRTPFEGRGTLLGGTLRGDLVVRASGDPVWHPEGRAQERLREVAQQLYGRGLRRIEGDLVLDEGSFLEPGPGPGWPDAAQHWADYCARCAGFSAQGGVLWAVVTPGAAGTRARISVHPTPHGLGSRYGVETTRGGPLDVRVGATRSAVTVKGSLAAGDEPFVATFAHPDPVALFGAVLESELRAVGIALEGEIRRERNIAIETRLPGPLAELRSSLDVLYPTINSDSNNSVADQLFLALGHTVVGRGTRDGALEAVQLALERLGVSTAGWIQVDGSGLSRHNRISAHQVTALLEAVLRGAGEAADLLIDSLAVAGRSGTLAKRLQGTPCEGRIFAKTGWIAGTSALSGVAFPLDGRTLVFSILIDYPPSVGGMNTHCFKPMQDRMCSILVEEEVP